MPLRRDAKLEAMAKVPLFAGLSKRHLGRLTSLADELDLAAGTTLMREGERGREFFVVLEGEVDVRRKGRKLNTVGPGGFLGEISLVSDMPRTATVTAKTPLHVLVLSASAFRTLLHNEPQVQLKVLQTLADRLANLTQA